MLERRSFLKGVTAVLAMAASGEAVAIPTDAPAQEASAPGWLLCNGQAVSRAAHKQLFDVLGTSYGAGDGRTTFNVPNMTEEDWLLPRPKGSRRIVVAINSRESHWMPIGAMHAFEVAEGYSSR